MDPNANLPAPLDLVTAYDLDHPSLTTSSRETTLTVDHKKAQFALGGDLLGERIRLVFLARRYFRVLFQKEFDDVREGEDNLVVCRSSDGFHGRGVGRRATDKELATGAWRADVTDRMCVDPRTQKKICPCAGGASLNEWLCRPKLRALVMFRIPDAEMWQPAFLEASGTAFRAADDAFKSVQKKMLMSAKRNEAGKMLPTVPLWRWGWEVTATEKQGRHAKAHCDVSWRGPTELGTETYEQVDAFARDTERGGPALWQADKEAANEALAQVGEEPAEQPSEHTGQAEPMFAGERQRGFAGTVPDDNAGGTPGDAGTPGMPPGEDPRHDDPPRHMAKPAAQPRGEQPEDFDPIPF